MGVKGREESGYQYEPVTIVQTTSSRPNLFLMVLLCLLLTANIAVMGFLSFQVYKAHQRYEEILPIARQISDSNIVKLLIKGENVFNLLASGRTIAEILDEDFIRFNWASGATALVKGAEYLKKIAATVAFNGPTQDIRDVFLYIQTYADWTQSIAQQATNVKPVGLLNPSTIVEFSTGSTNAIDNSTDNLDDVFDTFGELLPFLYKQIDIPKVQGAAKNCATLFRNVLNVNWAGTYRDYVERRIVQWQIPDVIQNEVFHTILETCEAASNPTMFNKPTHHSGQVKIADDEQ